MTPLVKANTVTLRDLWRSYRLIRFLNGRESSKAPVDMARSRSCSYGPHSYTSLKDVVGSSLPVANRQWNSHLHTFQSLPDIHHVHMKNPLLEKAAKVYLATSKCTQGEHHSESVLTSTFSSIMKIIRTPFQTTHRGIHSFFGGAFAWVRQMYIKI